ncbi:unnamed protein product, partial [Rotaria sp. Silwood1]
MSTQRIGHTATLLTNGKVFVIGGYTLDEYGYSLPLNSVELYDPLTGLWTRSANMTIGRLSHTAIRLANGKVLVAGGSGSDGSNALGAISSAELYDPSTGLWTGTGNMTVARQSHTATLLTNGKILVAGGSGYDGYRNSGFLNSAELYDPSTRSWTKTGDMSIGRQNQISVLLTNGKVLVAGGYYFDGYDYGGSINSPELYNPSTGLWTPTGNMSISRQFSTGSLLINGKVLAVGGETDETFTNGGFLSSTELYDPSTGLWTNSSNMNTGRMTHAMCSLANGTMLVTGGVGYDPNVFMMPLNDTELYNPSTGLWSKTDSMKIARALHTATLLT